MKQSIRILPDQQNRVETGTIQFGEDWPGVFIRGDAAAHFAIEIRSFLQNPNPLGEFIIENLAKLLESSNIVSRENETVQDEESNRS